MNCVKQALITQKTQKSKKKLINFLKVECFLKIKNKKKIDPIVSKFNAF